MPHQKAHPLAGRIVVPDEMTGAALCIVDWLDRMPEFAGLLASDTRACLEYRVRTHGQDLHDSGIVVAVDGRVDCLVHHAELPAYDPVPVGVIS